MPPKALIAFLLSMLAPLAIAAVPQKEPAARAAAAFDTIPLEHLLAGHPAQVAPPWGSLLQQKHEAFDHLDASLGRAAGSGEVLLDLLRQRHRTAIEAERLQLELLGPRLMVLGEESELATVRSTVLATSRLLLRTIELEFAAWDAADRETPPALMSAEEFARFAGNRPPLWRCTGHARSGDAEALQRLRWTDYVRDIDAEVAQKESLSRPMRDRFADGGQALMRPHLLVGNDIVLHVQFAAGQRRGIVRSLPTGMPGAADLELPVLESSFGLASGRLRSGGALAVTMRGHAGGGGQLVLTFRATLQPGAAAELPGDLAVLPVGALRSPALLWRQPLPLHQDRGLPARDAEPAVAAIDADQLHELLRTTIGEVGIADTGEFLVLQAAPAALEQAERLVRQLEDRWLRNATVQHLGTVHPAELPASGAAAGAVGASPLHELMLPTLFGREAFAARVLETNQISGIDVQIAQEAAMLDPVVQALQSGCWLRLRLAPLGDAAHCSSQLRCTHATLPQTRTIMPGGGVWMPSELAIGGSGHTGIVRSGQSFDHGEGPSLTIDGRVYRSALATTVRW
ncbi:MAG: hypothetical protein MUC36_25790 [Planctomycetes bacterium]|nr:hypothetical protein [Planctomycetota bacterium]